MTPPDPGRAKQRENGKVLRASGSLLDLDDTAQPENSNRQLGDAEHDRIRQQSIVDDSVVDRPLNVEITEIRLEKIAAE